MEHPVRSAFCPLYFRAHGGQFLITRPCSAETFVVRGTPIFRDGVLGTCDRPFDCGTCPLMSQWVVEMVAAGWAVGWECDQCLKDTLLEDKIQGVQRELPGFFQSCQPDDADQPPIGGCTRCGWQTSFLQIILRRSSG